jgi:glycosyltransferase involved in cell wall biosynthesis
MRIVQLIAPGPMAGAERIVLEGSQALHERGHTLELVMLDEVRKPQCGDAFASEAQRRGLMISRIPVHKRVDMAAVSALSRELRELAPEIVHVHGWKALAYAVAAAPTHAALLATHHGDTGHTHAVQSYEQLARVLYGAARLVFAVSDETAHSLRVQGVERLRTVENPVNLAPPSVVRPNCAKLGPTRLLFLGRLSPEKGLSVLLHALSRLNSFPWSLTVAGDGPERCALEELATELALERRVHFLGHRTDVASLLAASDVLVLPSLREGLPLAVLEAASLGIPVVASAVGGVPSVVEEGVTGLLVPPQDPGALVRALAELRADLDGFSWAARARARHVQERFSLARWAEATLDAYRSALS